MSLKHKKFVSRKRTFFFLITHGTKLRARKLNLKQGKQSIVKCIHRSR